MSRSSKPKAGKTLPAPVGIGTRYNAEVQALVSEMLRETEREVRRLFESPTAIESHVMTDVREAYARGMRTIAMDSSLGPCQRALAEMTLDASISSQARILINALQTTFSLKFAQRSKPLAERMVSQATAASATAVKRSLKSLSAGMALPTASLKTGPLAEIIKASVAENVGVIRSIPEKYLDNVRGAVMRSITTGNGLQDLVPFMEKQAGQTKRSAKNTALDQTRKAYGSMNAERMKAAGVKKAEWIHSGGGQKPRPLHVQLDGTVFSFDNPPVIDDRTGERGLPSVLPNCRCTFRPILDFGDGDE